MHSYISDRGDGACELGLRMAHECLFPSAENAEPGCRGKARPPQEKRLVPNLVRAHTSDKIMLVAH